MEIDRYEGEMEIHICYVVEYEVEMEIDMICAMRDPSYACWLAMPLFVLSAE